MPTASAKAGIGELQRHLSTCYYRSLLGGRFCFMSSGLDFHYCLFSGTRCVSLHGKNELEARGHLSSQKGDKARFNRLRKQKLRRRELMARLATQSEAGAA